jgi:ankyrin repeat protein
MQTLILFIRRICHGDRGITMMRRANLAFLIRWLCFLSSATVFSDPIHDAAKVGDLSLVKRLLNGGADINQHDNSNGMTPLFYAVITGHNDIVAYLLLKGADVHAVTAHGETILHVAASAGNVGAARLLRKHVDDINQADGYGVTPLDVAISLGRRDYVAYLIDAGAMKREEAATLPLINALKSRHKDIARILIESGIGIGEHNDIGVTPLHIAANLGYEHIVRALVDRGENINAEEVSGGTTPLFAAVFGGHLAVVEFLLEKGAAVNHVTKEHNTALIPATQRGDVEIVRTLLMAGADANIATDAGATPLIMAVQAHNPDVVAELLDHKADVNSASLIGDTPLTVAVTTGQRSVVETLLQHGANINVVRVDGTTVLDLAVLMGDPNLADLLRIRGAVAGRHDHAAASTAINNGRSDGSLPADATAQKPLRPLVNIARSEAKGLLSREPPPKGYAWQVLPVLQAVILMPKDWHLLVENNDKVDAVFLSREDIGDGGIFLTGLSVNAVRRAGIWSGKSVDAFAQQEDSRLFTLSSVKVDDKWTSDRSSIKQYGVRYRIIDPEGREHTAVKLTIVNTQSKSVYFLTFESLSREWSASEAIGQSMIDSLEINPEY